MKPYSVTRCHMCESFHDINEKCWVDMTRDEVYKITARPQLTDIIQSPEIAYQLGLAEGRKGKVNTTVKVADPYSLNKEFYNQGIAAGNTRTREETARRITEGLRQQDRRSRNRSYRRT